MNIHQPESLGSIQEIEKHSMEALSKMDIRQSAKKVRHVLDEINNLKVNDALKKLSFINKKSAKFIHQTMWILWE